MFAAINPEVKMHLTELKEVLATTASASSVLQLLSGILVCQKFMKKGSANDVSGMPFLLGLLSCSSWLGYGLITNDWALELVNLVGVILMASYTAAYYFYCSRKAVILKQLLLIIVIIAVTQIYSSREVDKELARTHMGLLGCCATVLFFAAPFANLAHVIKVKSSETLPLPLILMSLIVSAQWMLYGLILEDAFIIYPNFLGCLLSTLQLSLFVIYLPR